MNRPSSGYVTSDYLVLDSGPLEDAPGYQTPLARIVEQHRSAFEERVRTEAGRALPSFVLRELRALTHCADPCRGFLRLRCDACKEDRILPFRCKTSICPTCASRTMADRAAFLVDRVLRNDIGWRQFVVTFPPPLAVGLCFRPDLAARITRLCARALSQFQRDRAPDAPERGIPRSAAVVWPQRFADALTSWHHLHILVPEGVFREQKYRLSCPFEPQPAPTSAELRALLTTIVRRVTALVTRHAQTAPDDALLERFAAQPAQRQRGDAAPAPSGAKRPLRLCVGQDGFTLHAATYVPPDNADQLERLVRYVSRPPISNRRLRIRDDDRIELTLKRPRRGTTRFVFDPMALLARLAALVPRPNRHQILYYGCLSNGSPLRRYVIPVPPDPTPLRPTAPPRPQRMRWADLLARVFHKDATACPCGGRLRYVATITDPDVAQAVAAAIILSDQKPARAPPRR